jgi:hypothetical protein
MKEKEIETLKQNLELIEEEISQLIKFYPNNPEYLEPYYKAKLLLVQRIGILTNPMNKNPNEITDKTIVENFITGKSKTGDTWVIHSEVPFHKFEKMIFSMIDHGVTEIREIELDEFALLALKFHHRKFVLREIPALESFIKGIPNL